jgi:hypothetical protein
MIKKFSIGKLNLTFVFRHRWEKEHRFLSTMFNTKQLGLFWRKDMCVGRRKKGNAMFDSDNLVPSYMIGINLVFCKFWITFDINVLDIDLNR